MKYFLLCFCLFIGTTANAQEFKSIFNGKDLSGWTVHGTEKWYVEDGQLVCENDPDMEYGYLTTYKNNKNLVISLDFIQETNGNSCVFIRSTMEGTIVDGWQVEVATQVDNTGGI